MAYRSSVAVKRSLGKLPGRRRFLGAPTVMDPTTGFPMIDATGATVTADQLATATSTVTPALPDLSGISSSLSSGLSSMPSWAWLALAAGAAWMFFGKGRKRRF